MPTFFADAELTSAWSIALLLNTVLVAIAFGLPKKLLTPVGYLHAWALGVVVWGTLQGPGYTVVMFYFLVGSAVTKIGMAQKEAAGIAEGRGGRRGPENVWGSALAGTLCAIATLLWPAYTPLFTLGYVASFSTKLSDTTASEVGKAYGQRTFLITTLQPVPRGTEGAVSLEGTLAGAVASVVIAGLGGAIGLITPWGLLWCAVAAFIATNLESLIGATVQEKFTWLTNEVVNFINTLIGAGVAIALGALLR
ncbi:MAG: TIGR00297 family protein [Spirulinaceae cyanobacterium]